MELPQYFDLGHCQQFLSIGPAIRLTSIHKNHNNSCVQCNNLFLFVRCNLCKLGLFSHTQFSGLEYGSNWMDRSALFLVTSNGRGEYTLQVVTDAIQVFFLFLGSLKFYSPGCVEGLDLNYQCVTYSLLHNSKASRLLSNIVLLVVFPIKISFHTQRQTRHFRNEETFCILHMKTSLQVKTFEYEDNLYTVYIMNRSQICRK